MSPTAPRRKSWPDRPDTGVPDDSPIEPRSYADDYMGKHLRSIEVGDDDAPGPLIVPKPNPKPDDPWSDDE